MGRLVCDEYEDCSDFDSFTSTDGACCYFLDKLWAEFEKKYLTRDTEDVATLKGVREILIQEEKCGQCGFQLISPGYRTGT